MCLHRTKKWSGRLIVAVAPSGKSGIARLFGALFPVLAISLCAVIFSLTSVGTAEAHSEHQSDEVQSAASFDTDGPATVDTGALPDCGVDCCSPAHCTAGITSGQNSAFLAGRLTDTFLPPRETRALPFDQNTLKRPPRS